MVFIMDCSGREAYPKNNEHETAQDTHLHIGVITQRLNPPSVSVRWEESGELL